MRTRYLLYSLALSTALLWGCPTTDDDDDDSVEPQAAVADLDMDSDRTGVIDGTEDEEAAETEPPGVVLRVNVDDDNLSGECDNSSVSHVGDDENDMAPGVINFEPSDGVADGDTLVLTLSGDVEAFRLYIDQTPIMGMGGNGPITDKTLALSGGDSIDIEIEGIEWFATALLEIEMVDADGEVLSLDEVQLSTAPWLMQHHLDDSQEIWIMDGGYENAQLISVFEDVLGEENVHLLSTGQYQWDVWIQDEVQWGYQITPEGPMSVVFDTPRDGQGGGGLTNFAPTELLAPDRGWFTVGEGNISSLDYGGNLECTPPLSVDGTEYPFGRIYYGGKEGSGQPLQGIRDFFDAQTVQSPLMIDSTWLAVGHVDEFMSFVPVPESDKGFKVLWTDHMLAAELLAEVDPNLSIPRYQAHGYLTVGEILDDAIMDYSADIDAVDQQPVMDMIKTEFGLTDDDFIRLPGIWEQTNWGALAMVTGMVNLTVFDQHLFVPDPWLRDQMEAEEDTNGNFVLDPGEDLNGDGMLNTHNDPFRQYVESVLPASLEVHWVDTWQMYHLYWGEIHCGSEIRRNPTADLDWWDVAIPE